MDINHKTTAGTVPHFSSLNEKKQKNLFRYYVITGKSNYGWSTGGYQKRITQDYVLDDQR